MPRALLPLALAAALAGPAAADGPPAPPAPKLDLAEVVGLARQFPGGGVAADLLRSARLTFRLNLSEVGWFKDRGLGNGVQLELTLAPKAPPAAANPFPPKAGPVEPTAVGPNPFRVKQPAAPAPQVQRSVAPGPDGKPLERLGIDFNEPSNAEKGAVPGGLSGAATGDPKVGAVGGPVGTWYRDYGPMQVVLKVRSDSLTVRMVTVTELPGVGEMAAGSCVTADYTRSADGKTLTATVVAADPVSAGYAAAATLDELNKETKGLRELVGRSFTLSARVSDDDLIVSGVKAGPPADVSTRGVVDVLAGCYTSAGDKPVPAPKPVRVPLTHTERTDGPTAEARMSGLIGPAVPDPVAPPVAAPNAPPAGPTEVAPPPRPAPAKSFGAKLRDAMRSWASTSTRFGGMTLPSPHYLQHYPQYFPPDPAFPLQRELDSAVQPAGGMEVAPMPRATEVEVAPPPRPAAPVPAATPTEHLPERDGPLPGFIPAAARPR